MLHSIRPLALQGLLVIGLSAAVWPAHAAIGTFQFTFGDVKVVNVRGEARAAQKGVSLDEGETVVTGAAASAQLKMVDGGVLAVRPDTQLKFDTYRYPGREDGTERGFMSLVKGGFRTITGAIGRLNKPNYQVTTPTATVGIRGTDHEVIHIPIPAAGQIALGAPGTYDKVNVGAAYIRNPAGTININANQVGFAPPVPTQPPVLLPKVPDFFRPAPPPAPVKAAAKEQPPQAEAAKPKPAPEAAPAPAAAAAAEAAPMPAPAPAAAPAPAPAAAPEPIRALTVLDNQSQMVAIASNSAIAAATPAAAAPPIVAQVIAPTPTAATSPAGSTSGAPPAGAITVTLTGSGGLSLDTTQQTITTSTGQTASIAQGVFAVQAQAAADAAASSASALDALLAGAGTAATGTLASAVASASPPVSAADSAVKSVAGLTIGSAAAASASASNLTAVAQTAANQASTLTVSSSQVDSALATVQSNLELVQSAANNVVSQANALPGLVSSAASTANEMNASMAAASNALSSLAGLGVSQSATAQSQLSVAQNAASAAHSAAELARSLQDSGDFTGAEAQMAIAQREQQTAAKALSVARTIIDGIAAATAAQVKAGTSSDTAGTAFGYANAAQAAVSSASASLAQTDPTVASPSPSAANLVKASAEFIANVVTSPSAVLAQAAADQAAASVSALNAAIAAAGVSVTSPLPTVLASATSAVSAAQSAVTSALNLSIDSAAAASTASNVAALAQTAATRTSAASAGFAANGTFADPHIAPVALAAVQAVVGEIQSNAALVQTEAGNVAAQATVLAGLKSSTSAATSAMNASISAANNALSALAGLGVSQSTTAEGQLSIAQSAASAAQNAATQAQSLQGAGDLTGAQSALATAQQQQTIAANALAAAQKLIEGISAALAAESAAGTSVDTTGTAFGYANAAQAAVISASESLAQIDPAASGSAANVVQTKAQVVADNYLKAQYSNPAVAASNFRHGTLAMKAVTGGVENQFAHEFQPSANTVYVLDENKNLVEIRDTAYSRTGSNYVAQAGTIGSTSIQFSGGTPQDHFRGPDGAAYMGRWQGGQVTVIDNGVPSSTDLGNTSAHWLIGLAPGDSLFSTSVGTINNVQRLIGTSSYSLLASTKPTDSLGNVGTLNSASLTANFTAQTVDAGVNLSFPTRSLTLDANAQNVPIDGSGFRAAAQSSYAPAVNCTGSGCSTAAPLGYTGEIRGGFTAAASAGATTGAVGTGAGLMYSLTPLISPDFATPPTPGTPTTPPTGQPFADLIQGAAMFGTTVAPTVGINSSFADNTNLRHRLVYPISMTASAQTAFASVSNSSFMPNTNYLFDASGNLVRVHDSDYSIFITGDALTSTSTPSSSQFPTQRSPFTDAQISFGLGSTAAESYSSEGQSYSAIGLRMGRWQGGAVNVTDLIDFNTAFLDPLGGRSAHWVVAQVPSAIPVSGQFHYTRLPGSTAGSLGFATAPTDAYGNVGVLDGARLNVDFTNLAVNTGVRIHINSGPGGALGEQSLSASASNVDLVNGNFNVSSGDVNPLKVSCIGTGCAPVNATTMPGYGGRINGSLSGLDAEGAFFRYTFNTNYATQADAAAAGRVKDDFINGMVGFQRGPEIKPAVAAATTGPALISTAYLWDLSTPPAPGDTTPRPFIQTQNFGPLSGPSVSTGQPGYTFDTGGNLSEVVDSNDFGSGDSIIVSGGTPINAQAPSFATTGITFGRYDNSAAAPILVTSINSIGDGSDRSNLNSGFHWIKGPAQFPFYLSSALNITGTAIYSKDAGVAVDQSGAAGTLSFAELNVDFTKQAVDFFLSATTASGNWDASTPAPVRLDGSGGFFATTGSVGGTINGQSVADVEASTNNKLAAFFTPTGGSPQNARGNANGQLTGTGLNGAILSYALAAGSGNSVAGTVAFAGEAQNTLADYRGVLSATGMTSGGTSAEEMNYLVGGTFAPASRVSLDNNGVLGRFDGYQPLVVAPSCAGCTPNVRDVPATFLLTSPFGGGATVSNAGFDTTSGIRWGRYDGTINMIDRITGVTSTVSPSITLGPGGAHFIYTGTQSGPTVLPVSGTFNYTFAGGTSPTDSNGNVGAPLTSANASLTANFTSQTVNASLSNVVVGGNTWNASATSIPIVNNIFQAQKKLGGDGNLTVTSTLGTNTAGNLVGVFTGATGRGAGIAYSLNHGGNVATNPAAVTVSGVAAFKR